MENSTDNTDQQKALIFEVVAKEVGNLKCEIDKLFKSLHEEMGNQRGAHDMEVESAAYQVRIEALERELSHASERIEELKQEVSQEKALMSEMAVEEKENSRTRIEALEKRFDEVGQLFSKVLDQKPMPVIPDMSAIHQEMSALANKITTGLENFSLSCNSVENSIKAIENSNNHSGDFLKEMETYKSAMVEQIATEINQILASKFEIGAREGEGIRHEEVEKTMFAIKEQILCFQNEMVKEVENSIKAIENSNNHSGDFLKEMETYKSVVVEQIATEVNQILASKFETGIREGEGIRQEEVEKTMFALKEQILCFQNEMAKEKDNIRIELGKMFKAIIDKLESLHINTRSKGLEKETAKLEMENMIMIFKEELKKAQSFHFESIVAKVAENTHLKLENMFKPLNEEFKTAIATLAHDRANEFSAVRADIDLLTTEIAQLCEILLKTWRLSRKE